MRAISSPSASTPLLLLLLLLLPAGCGDGDGDGESSSGEASGATTSTTAASATSSASQGSGGATSADATTTTTTGSSDASGSSAATTGDGTAGSSGTASTSGPDTGTGEDTSTGGQGTSTGGGLLELPWTYIAALDRGIRDDAYGLGHFTAPRQGYQHSGIDFSMPVGTPLYAPCDGVYLAGYDGGYGNWVQVICPIPATIAGDQTVYGSLLYAHLDALAVPTTGINPNNAGEVARGQTIGASGKSGNASAEGINAHLHFEVALHASELAGLQEAHISGADQDTPAAAALRDELALRCLGPTGFAPTKSPLNLGRRIDPFVLLTCLVADKPALSTPGDQALHAWSDEYAADAFDVDVGIQ